MSLLCEMVGQAGSPARLWNLSPEVPQNFPSSLGQGPLCSGLALAHLKGVLWGDSGLIAFIDHKQFFLIFLAVFKSILICTYEYISITCSTVASQPWYTCPAPSTLLLFQEAGQPVSVLM